MLWGASGGGYSCSRIFPPSCCHTLKLGAVLVKEMAALFEARGKVVPWRAAAACHRSAGARPLYAVHKALCFYGPSGPGCGLVGHWRWGSAARIIRHKACERCSLQEEAVLLWGTGGGGVLPEWSITKLGRDADFMRMLHCCGGRGAGECQKAAPAAAPPCWRPPGCLPGTPGALEARSCCAALAGPCTGVVANFTYYHAP